MKQRQSNIELLRLIAMFMILTLHALHLGKRMPDSGELHVHTQSVVSQVVVEMLCLVAVNVFVIISGWFGLKFSWKGVSKIAFQCVYAGLICSFASWLYTGMIPKESLFCTLYVGAHLWFVPAYLGLMVLSPILNAYVEKASQKEFRNLLGIYFAFEMIYGFVWRDLALFSNGYSLLHFIGIYMLARYLYLYSEGWKFLTSKLAFVFYVLCVVFASVLIILGIEFGDNPNARELIGHMIAYNSPLTILSAVFLFMAFVKMRSFQSRFINWAAGSCFSIYLIQESVPVSPLYRNYMENVINTSSGVLGFVLVGSLIFIIGWACIILDQPRVWIWKILSRKNYS